MTDLELVRGTKDPHVFELSTFGQVRFPSSPRGEVVIFVPGQPEWLVNTWGEVLHAEYHAIEAETEVATFTAMSNQLVAGSRELLLSRRRGTWWKGGPWLISEQGRDFASISYAHWVRPTIPVRILDDAAAHLDPRLTLFALWCAGMLSQS